MYEKSFMHRETMQFVLVTKTNFIITTSMDGHLKFWKKCETGIEFVKTYRAHLAPITAVALSDDGLMLASASLLDQTLKVYDVINFGNRVLILDMINMVKLQFKPKAICWTFKKGDAMASIAVSDAESTDIHLFDGKKQFTDRSI